MVKISELVRLHVPPGFAQSPTPRPCPILIKAAIAFCVRRTRITDRDLHRCESVGSRRLRRPASATPAPELVHGEIVTLMNGYLEAPLLTGRVSGFVTSPGLGARAGVLGALALAESACATAI
jgi:hypothetical protein